MLKSLSSCIPYANSPCSQVNYMIKSISNDKVYRRGNIRYVYIGFIDKEKGLIYGADRKIESHFNYWVPSTWTTEYFQDYVLEQLDRSNQSKDSMSVARQKTIKYIL